MENRPGGSTGGGATPLTPAPSGRFESLGHLAGSLTALLLLHVAYDVAAAVSDVQLLGLLERVRDGASVPAREVNADLELARWSEILQTVGAAAVGIPFIVWLRRAYLNLGPLGTRSLRFKPGWATGAWFVPGANYALPKAIVNDVWRASDPGLPPEVDRPPKGAPVPIAINLWWAAWVAALTTLPRLVPDEVDAARADDVIRGVQRGLAGDVLLIVAGLLAVVTVRRVTRRQEERYARLGYSAGPPLR